MKQHKDDQLEDIVEIADSEQSSICKRFPCNVARISGRDCSDYKNCQTYKFNEKYGTEKVSVAIKVPNEFEGEYKN